MKQELIDLSNGYLANIGVSYIKLHNLHWNVVGGQFKPVHEYLESLYDSLAAELDEVAEFIRIDGGLPLASLKDFLSAATIQELESRELDVKSALSIVLADLELLKEQASAVRAAADAEGHFVLVSALEDHVASYSKNIWFIRSMLK